jgi:chemotaxis methyl-accepting protein methylase
MRRLSGHLFGRHLNTLVRLQADRQQYFATFFLRNRPALELMRRLVDRTAQGSTINVCVLACSKGAEVYSIAWTLRSARPDLKVHIQAIDISQEILDFAERGVYSLTDGHTLSTPGTDERIGTDLHWNTQRDQSAWIFERMAREEMDALFDIENGQARVKPWIKDGITWLRGDANDPELVEALSPQDIVVASCFLCHMAPKVAAKCLGNIAQMVRPGGYLFVSGIDLDVRTEVARELGWEPVKDLMKEIHEGDISLREGWPLEYWGLEPLARSRPDWQIRYASAFQIGETTVRSTSTK